MNKELINKIIKNRKNLIIAGDTLTNKTINIMYPLLDSIIENNESFLVLDTKEEYLNKYYKTLKEKNYNIIILNLKELQSSDCWNPLSYPYKLYQEKKIDKAIDYLEKIAKTIFYKADNEDPFWSNCASDLFMGVALSLFQDGKPEEINLISINNIINSAMEKNGVTDYLTSYLKLKGEKSQEYLYAEPTILSPVDTKGGILTVARERLRTLISRDNLNLAISQNTFDISEIPNKKTAVILIAKEESRKLNVLASLFIEQLFLVLYNNNKDKNYYFLLDNFDNLNKINEFSEILSAGIAKNIRFYLVTRSLEQLFSNYNKYILKLSDEIYTTIEEIKFNINNQETIIKNLNNNIDIPTCEIEYPTLQTNQINTFDVKEFVNKKSKISTKENNTIEKLVKEIDNKLKEIDSIK